MKHLPVLILAVVFIFHNHAYAQVAINNTGTAPDGSAMLDVSSNSKGFLPPRMTQAQRDLIPSPQTGIIIYQTDGLSGLYCNNGTTGFPAWQLQGPAALAFGYFNETSIQPANGAARTNIPFNPNYLYNIPFTGNNSVTVSIAGTYRIAYHISMITNNTTCEVYLTVNNSDLAVVPAQSSTTYMIASLSQEYIVNLNAGDIIVLKFANTGGGPVCTCYSRSLEVIQIR